MKIPIFLLCFQAFQTTNDKRDRSFKVCIFANTEELQIESVFKQRALLFVGFALPLYVHQYQCVSIRRNRFDV